MEKPHAVAESPISPLDASLPVVRDHKEAVENTECDCRHGEEIHCGNCFAMVAEKRRPSLCRLRISRRFPHPSQNSTLRNVVAEHLQLAMHPRRTPSPVPRYHAEYQSRNSWLVGFLPTTACLREIHFQYCLNPARCQRTTVSGCTNTRASHHPDQNRRDRTKKIRSEAAIRGPEHLGEAAASCCRRAKFSRMRSRRERRSPAMSIRKRFNVRSMAPFSHQRTSFRTDA
jgi:hypothetical protein